MLVTRMLKFPEKKFCEEFSNESSQTAATISSGLPKKNKKRSFIANCLLWWSAFDHLRNLKESLNKQAERQVIGVN